MLITVLEHSGCFSMELTAETVADAALLVRFGVNANKEITHLSAYAGQGGTVGASIVFPKNKKTESSLPRRT